MNWFNAEIIAEIELRRYRSQQRTPAARYLREWHSERHERRIGRTRTAAWWAGERLVRAGERLRAWSGAGAGSRVSEM